MNDYKKLAKVLEEIGIEFYINHEYPENVHVTVRNEYEDVECQTFTFMFNKITGEYKER